MQALSSSMAAEEGRRRRPQQQQEQQQQQQRRRRRRPAARMTATTLLLSLAGAAAVAQAFVVPGAGPSSYGLVQQRPGGVGAAWPPAASIRGRRGLATLFMGASMKEGGKQQQASGFDPLGAAAGSKALAAVGKEKKGEVGVVGEGGGEGEEEKGSLLIYKGMLLVVAILWGSNFGALKYLDTCGVEVSLLTSMRFLLASVALLPFLVGKGWGVLKAGLEVGLWVTLGYITQAIGLETTDVSYY